MTTPVKGVEAEPQFFAVVCKWADRRGPVLKDEGHEAVVVEASNANEALLAVSLARPDLWEPNCFTRETAVHHATRLESAAS